jgi:RNA polymerase sigma-70 factor (ECF subfamily)
MNKVVIPSSRHPVNRGRRIGMTSDAELVRQARLGGPDAYTELVRRWAARVTALCHARVGRAHVADDMAQETLLRGFRSLHTLNDPERFGPWLCGIAMRICLDWLKAKKNSQIPFSALGDDRRPDDFLHDERRCGIAELEHDDERRRLLAEVEALPEEYRRVVMLYYYEDVTYRDVAELLGVSTATVNARLTKARALLRARLTRCI